MFETNKQMLQMIRAQKVMNPFSVDIRNYKTVFNIVDIESMMEFGIWLLTQCENEISKTFYEFDPILQLCYELMRCGNNRATSVCVIVEKSFEELYVTMLFDSAVNIDPDASPILRSMQNYIRIHENAVFIQLNASSVASVMVENRNIRAKSVPRVEPRETKSEEIVIAPAVDPMVTDESKEVRVIESKELDMLRQSFVHKTSAAEYVREIGGDVLDEIRDLGSLDEEWQEKIRLFEDEPTAANLNEFVDRVLNVYVRAINNLFEFASLAYALSALGAFLKENAGTIVSDAGKIKMLVMLSEHLGNDLTSWREHVFGLQDTADIHYLDSSFFSSCVQIEGILGDKEVNAVDDDNDIEFF